MNPAKPHPVWDSASPYESLIATANYYHIQAMHTFLEDKSHAHILFLVSAEKGVVSVNPLPPKVSEKQVLNGVRQAVREHNLYAVISITEAWTYFRKQENDHTIVQLMHNEMRVADLNDDDKVECLMVRMECRDKMGFTWVTQIIRDKQDEDNVTLGDSVKVPLDYNLKNDMFFV